MIKRMILVVTALVVVFGGVFGWDAYRARMVAQAMASAKRPPVTVSAIEASTATWQPTLTAVGTLRAARGVLVSSELSGIVRKIHFDSGASVKEGDLLVQLDDSTEQAQLRAARAESNLAKTEFDRDEKLVKIHGASEADFDAARSRLETARARVAELESVIDKKSVQAPFPGILGIRQVDLGEYLSPGTPIVDLQALDPIYADFPLPQQALSRVREGQTVQVTSDAYPDASFPGKIEAIEPRIDPATRSFRLRAVLKNEEGRLRPGMFVRVEVVLPEKRKVVTLPQTAVTYSPYGDSVFRVQGGMAGKGGKSPLTAKRVFIQTGEKRGDQVAIVSGVTAGDRVVSAGQLKLRDGDSVRIDNSVTPANEPSPEPADQ